jgi:hypothetical protein
MIELLADDDETCEILSPEEIAEEIERLIYLRVLDLVEQLEFADLRDRWRYTGEAPPAIGIPITTAKQSYRTPQSTIDAFFYVAGLGDADYLLRWLAQHPLDAPYLRKIWSANARA